MPLTIEKLFQVKALLEAQEEAPPVGIAMSPRTHAALFPYLPLTPNPPVLVDPRITQDLIEVFYDADAWHSRCEEQNKYDTLHVRINH